jgi:very-short-patch-repair endonuclease
MSYLAKLTCLPCEKTQKTLIFIELSKKIHGDDKYNYDFVDYKNNLTEVIIYCNFHKKTFLQIPKTHLRGNGCKECGILSRASKNVMSIDEFIKRAKEIHGDKYIYDEVNYINSKTCVVIKCKEGHKFIQKPYGHISITKSAGCKKCADKKNGEKLTMTTEQFIEKALQKHGTVFSYKNVVYNKNHIPILITCSMHGDFPQTPNSHLSGSGCPKCIGRRKTTEEFIIQVKKIHGDKYNYDKVVYEKANKKVEIFCSVTGHGYFKITPTNHLTGNGCEKCGKKQYIFTTDQFIEESKKIHNKTYTYNKSNYINMTTLIIITCNKHGDFSQTPSNHITHKQGCMECGRIKTGLSKRKSIEDFIERSNIIHKYITYDYSKVHEKYTVRSNKVEIGCNRCKAKGFADYFFLQSPSDHLSGRGCRKCIFKTQQMVVSMLNDYIHIVKKFEDEYKLEGLKNIRDLRFDFFLEYFNIILELDGGLHFREFNKGHFKNKELKKTQERDFMKMKFALNKGITIIRIYQEDVFNNNYDWINDILNHIKIYDTPQVIYLSKNKNFYDSYSENFIKYFQKNNQHNNF